MPYSTRGQSLLNIVKQWYFMPCSPTPLVYIDLALASIAKFGYSYFSPDIRELVTRTTGRSSLCHIKTGVNAEAPKSYGYPKAVKSFLWDVVEVLDRATFYGFLIGIGASASYDFFHGAVKMAGCVNPPPHGRWGYGTRAYGGWPGTNAWYDGPTWRAGDWPVTPGTPTSWHVPPGGTVTIAGTMQAATSGGIPMPFNFRMYWPDTGEVPWYKEGDFDPVAGSHMAALAKVTNAAATTRELYFQVQFPLAPPSSTIAALPFGPGYAWWNF